LAKFSKYWMLQFILPLFFGTPSLASVPRVGSLFSRSRLDIRVRRGLSLGLPSSPVPPPSKKKVRRFPASLILRFLLGFFLFCAPLKVDFRCVLVSVRNLSFFYNISCFSAVAPLPPPICDEAPRVFVDRYVIVTDNSTTAHSSLPPTFPPGSSTQTRPSFFPRRFFLPTSSPSTGTRFLLVFWVGLSPNII